MRVCLRRDSRWELSYQQGGDLRGELGPQIAVQNRPEPTFENRNQDGLDFGPETRFEPSSEFRAELRLQREFEDGTQATGEFRSQSRVQVALQVGRDKGSENAGQMRDPDENPAAGSPRVARSLPSSLPATARQLLTVARARPPRAFDFSCLSA